MRPSPKLPTPFTSSRRKSGSTSQPVRKLKVEKHRGGQEQDFYFVVEDGKGVVIAPSDSAADVQSLILSEMLHEAEDGSGARNLTQYLAEYDIPEARIKQELARMRKPAGGGLVKFNANKWWLTNAGKGKAAELAEIEQRAFERESMEMVDCRTKLRSNRRCGSSSQPIREMTFEERLAAEEKAFTEGGSEQCRCLSAISSGVKPPPP